MARKWRAARAALVLQKQINAAAPDRAKGSDGTIGNLEHQSRESDHNAWIKPVGDGRWVVSAIDITHDPRSGADCNKIVDALWKSRDDRIKYIIWNRRICHFEISPWKWRPYGGPNPHTAHFHLSLRPISSLFDDERPWAIGKLEPDGSKPPAERKPTLKRGSKGKDVEYLQTLLGIPVDGHFGKTTETAVLEWQKGHGPLVVDGVVGPMTWDSLMKGEKS